MMIRLTSLAVVLLFSLVVFPVRAGLVDAPSVFDTFDSRLDLELSLLPSWTGLPGPIPASLTLETTAPTVVERELVAITRSGVDAIDVEMVSMELVGSSPIGPVGIRVGEGNGFAPGLLRSGGEVREKAPTAPNGVMDTPDFDSIFDVFFDVWIDLNLDTIIDPGELLRNTDVAVHMENFALSSLPPALDGTDPYVGGNQGVSVNDPNLGMFGSALVGPIDLFPIDPISGVVIGPAHATAIAEIHTPVPEPASLALLSLGLAGIGYRRHRSKITA